jgi:hypothetical protein
VKLFSDQDDTTAEIPAALQDARFLHIPIDGQKTIKCERASIVFLLTPVLDRNRDTASQPSMDQGFEKVALPEIPLFNPASPANYCTLFQKDCAAGETIFIRKWTVLYTSHETHDAPRRRVGLRSVCKHQGVERLGVPTKRCFVSHQGTEVLLIGKPC